MDCTLFLGPSHNSLRQRASLALSQAIEMKTLGKSMPHFSDTWILIAVCTIDPCVL